MFLVPNSWGSLREGNDCHEPAGRPIGGQFCSRGGGSKGGGTHRVSLGQINEGAIRKIFGKDLSGTAIKAIAKDMMAGVEGDFEIQVRTQELQDNDTGKNKWILRVTMIGDDGTYTESGAAVEADTKLIRFFYRDEDGNLCVKHSSFEKNPSKPADWGKDVLRAHMETYQRLGVHKIVTYANIDVGSYAWAKYGFVAEDPEAVNTLIEDGAENLYGMTVHNTDREKNPVGKGVGMGDREIRALKAMKSSSRLGIWNLADFEIEGVKVGKALLMQSDGWEAYMLLDGSPLSQRQTKRFWSYVGKR